MNPTDLGKILTKLNENNILLDNNVGGFQTSDDCSIYPLDDNNLLIQSLDFFTPIVDNPYDFGRIAAVNALSDIYAMGGKPIFALNITCFPTDKLPLDVLHEILRGGSDIAKKANIPILGGHSIKDNEPKYGLVVSGIVSKSKLMKNNTAQLNDNLILTKPIGTGIISTAIKNDLASKEDINNIVNVMTELNDKSSLAMNNINASACTDITGYGLLGHLQEMCRGSNLNASIDFNKIPLINNVIDYANKGVVPGGTKRNLEHYGKLTEFDISISNAKQLIMADAQTSGGLLISVSEDQTNKLIDNLKNANCLSQVIGKIVKKEKKYLISVY